MVLEYEATRGSSRRFDYFFEKEVPRKSRLKKEILGERKLEVSKVKALKLFTIKFKKQFNNLMI